MKKALGLFLSFIPLLSSCNKNGGFEDPFKPDDYTPIGFNFDTKNESIVRYLTTDEIKIVKDTTKDYDNKIYYKKSVKEERNYLRAFAGDFKQGYSISNVKKNEKSESFRRDESKKSGKIDTTQRTYTVTESTSLSQYSYGNINEKIKNEEFVYYAKLDDKKKYIENNNGRDESESLNIRNFKTENDKYLKKTDSGPKVSKDEGAEWTPEKIAEAETYLYKNFKQSDYITEPDQKSGADADGNIILVKTTQSKIKIEGMEEGILQLADGRKYQAMNNSLTVTKLVKKVDEESKESKKWGLVTYVRHYTETVVTSEIIQPNVPVEKLKKPIPIYYVEEITNFADKDGAPNYPEAGKVAINNDYEEEAKK